MCFYLFITDKFIDILITKFFLVQAIKSSKERKSFTNNNFLKKNLPLLGRLNPVRKNYNDLKLFSLFSDLLKSGCQ